MEKENIDSISFNLIDGQRSEYANFTLKEEFERFSFGDWFGCDSQTLWISEDNRIAEFQEELDEEEKLYRKVAWCTENGFDIDEVLEDEDGEFVFEEVHNYSHPTDEGASVETKKVYLTYKEVTPNLEEVTSCYV